MLSPWGDGLLPPEEYMFPWDQGTGWGLLTAPHVQTGLQGPSAGTSMTSSVSLEEADALLDAFEDAWSKEALMSSAAVRLLTSSVGCTLYLPISGHFLAAALWCGSGLAYSYACRPSSMRRGSQESSGGSSTAAGSTTQSERPPAGIPPLGGRGQKQKGGRNGPRSSRSGCSAGSERPGALSGPEEGSEQSQDNTLGGRVLRLAWWLGQVYAIPLRCVITAAQCLSQIRRPDRLALVEVWVGSEYVLWVLTHLHVTFWCAAVAYMALGRVAQMTGVTYRQLLLTVLQEQHQETNLYEGRVDLLRKKEYGEWLKGNPVRRRAPPSHPHGPAADCRTRALHLQAEMHRDAGAGVFGDTLDPSSNPSRDRDVAGFSVVRGAKDFLSAHLGGVCVTGDPAIKLTDQFQWLAGNLDRMAGRFVSSYHLQPSGLAYFKPSSHVRFVGSNLVEERVDGSGDRGASYLHPAYGFGSDILVLSDSCRTAINHVRSVRMEGDDDRVVSMIIPAKVVGCPLWLLELVSGRQIRGDAESVRQYRVESRGEYLLGHFGSGASATVQIVDRRAHTRAAVLSAPVWAGALAMMKCSGRGEITAREIEDLCAKAGNHLLGPKAEHQAMCFMVAACLSTQHFGVMELNYTSIPSDGRIVDVAPQVEVAATPTGPLNPPLPPGGCQTRTPEDEAKVVEERVTAIANTVTPHQRWSKYAVEFAEQCIWAERLGLGIPLSGREVVDSRKKTMQRKRGEDELKRLSKLVATKGPYAKQVLRLLMKVEAGDGGVGRGVMNPSEDHKIKHAELSIPLAVALKKLCGAFYPGATPRQTAERLCRLRDEVGEPLDGYDMSRMDGRLPALARQVLRLVVKRFYCKSDADELARHIDMLLDTEEAATVKFRGGKAKSGVSNLSGSAWTTILNCLCLIFTGYGVFRDQGLTARQAWTKVNKSMAVFGDDTAMARSLGPKFAEACKELGMKAAPEKVSEVGGCGEAFSFLSRVYPSLTTTPCSHPRIVRAFRKLVTDVNGKRHFEARCAALLETDGHVRLLCDYARACLRIHFKWSPERIGTAAERLKAVSSTKDDDLIYRINLGPYPTPEGGAEDVLLCSVAADVGLDVPAVRVLIKQMEEATTPEQLASVKFPLGIGHWVPDAGMRIVATRRAKEPVSKNGGKGKGKEKAEQEGLPSGQGPAEGGPSHIEA